MSARNLTMTVITVFGLIFVIGTGCSDKDDGSKKLAAALRAELDAKQKELDCKVSVLKSCSTSDAACDKAKVDGLAACSAAAASATAVSTSIGSTTATITSTATSTASATGTAVSPGG